MRHKLGGDHRFCVVGLETWWAGVAEECSSERELHTRFTQA